VTFATVEGHDRRSVATVANPDGANCELTDNSLLTASRPPSKLQRVPSARAIACLMPIGRPPFGRSPPFRQGPRLMTWGDMGVKRVRPAGGDTAHGLMRRFFSARRKIFAKVLKSPVKSSILVRFSRFGVQNLGRPPFSPNKRDRKIVEILVCAGWTQNRISLALDIDTKTLRKHCRDELDHGAERCRRELIEAFAQKAAAGSSTARRLLRRLGIGEDSIAVGARVPVVRPLT
jgi:hypothetical protein